MYFHAHSIPETSGMTHAAVSRRLAAPGKPLKFLVAFDGSPAARVALEYAADFARAEGGNLHVLNVQEAFIDNAEIQHVYQRRGERILEDVTEQLAPFGTRFTAEVAFGSPARAIVRTARRARCDHIVMGTRNRSSLASLLSPRVSRQVLRLADVPVTVVKEEKK